MDLNLLMALDALLEHNSVALAAERLHLTPPAVSRTLARIRHVTGDDILVRAGRAMLPTPYALSIRDPVRQLVQAASTVLKPAKAFDAHVLDRVFTVRGHDALLSALAAPLVASLAVSAPAVRLRLLGEEFAGGHGELRHEVDVELGATLPEQPEISHELVGTDRLVLAMRADHPLARNAVSAVQLTEVGHVVVSRRGRLRDRLDDALAEQGLSRRVLASMPTAAAALEVVAQSDLVTVVAQQAGAALCSAFGVVQQALPVSVLPLPVVLSWHRRFDSDAGHRWMRCRMAEALQVTLRH